MGWWGRLRGRELPVRDRGPEAIADGEMKAGKKHGLWIEHGQYTWKWVESLYRDGVRQGPYREWHEDRWLLERGTFVDGEKDGDVEFFSRAGKLITIAAHRAGTWHGPMRAFDDDGSVKYEREYRDGTVYAGPYDLKSVKDDQWIHRKTFKDGHPIGLYEEYELGKLKLHANYDDDGVLHGAWRDYYGHYDQSGVKLEGAYAKGARTGAWQWHAKDGSIIASCDYSGDGAWTMPDGTKLDARDEADLPRWIALAAAMGARHHFHIEHAIDAWPEDDRERAVAWVEAKLGPHRITVGVGDWLGALLKRDEDPRWRLIGGISTDHGRYDADCIARIVAHAGQLRVLSFDEEDLEPSADALFPPGVAWPKLERLWIHESGPLGTIVRTLAEAPWAAALRELGLDDFDGDLSDADSAALIASPHLASLRTLHLSNFGSIAKAIAKAPMFASLEDVEIRYTPDALAVVEAIAARDTPKLKSLELYGEGELSRNTVIGLCAKARHPALESLTLQDFDVSEKIKAEIKKKYPSLKLYVY